MPIASHISNRFNSLTIDPFQETNIDFVDRYLYGETEGAFSVIPLGFSPIPQVIDGGNEYFSWQVIAGDFEAFKVARREELGDGVLMRAETISLEL